MNNTKKQITMFEALESYFERPYKCKLCGEILDNLVGVSVHWRKKHQHETKVKIVPVIVCKK